MNTSGWAKLGMMKYLKFLIMVIINYQKIPRRRGWQKNYLKYKYQLSKFEYLDGGVGKRGQAVTDCSQFQAPHRLEG